METDTSPQKRRGTRRSFRQENIYARRPSILHYVDGIKPGGEELDVFVEGEGGGGKTGEDSKDRVKSIGERPRKAA